MSRRCTTRGTTRGAPPDEPAAPPLPASSLPASRRTWPMTRDRRLFPSKRCTGWNLSPGGLFTTRSSSSSWTTSRRLDIRHERDGARRPAKHPAHPRRRDTTAQQLRHLRVAHSPFAAERERPRGVREGGFVSGDGGGGGGDVAPSVGRDGGDDVGATLGDVLTELVRVGRLYGLQTRWAGHGRALARSFGRAGRVVESPGDGRARGSRDPCPPGGCRRADLREGV